MARGMWLADVISIQVSPGEPVFHVFGAIARFERRLIADRIKDGIVAARAKGKRPSRPPRTASLPR